MSSSHKKNDVFISFRGEDTRETFTSHLYDALKKEKIETYIDYKLQKGDQVWCELVKAIQHSTVSIVVFSENYASSKWCLDELVQILECRKNNGQVVIPVFYRVDPSHIRHQKESYERAFAKYEREIRNDESHEEKVLGWKAALREAANISGWDSSTFKDDSHIIENIVRDVCQKLTLMYPKVLKGIQIDENSKHVDLLVKKVSRIGIWGMGGIGKTTIARLMFVKNIAKYDSVCFMEKVKEESEKLGLTQVRNNIFSELLKRQITASDVIGYTFIKRRLSGRKVFIVLDNVGNAAQLDYLCGELDELGLNSRLIITTRDRHTLRGRVDAIHEVKKWNFEESLNLFIFEAFKQSCAQKGYEGLLERAVEYAGGVPLALKVLGSHFHSRSPKFWKSELDYLKDKRECMDEIQKVLQVSYSGLTKREKEIFLDIAFFYEGESKNFATKILDACGFSATSGIEILEDKALITFSISNTIQVHDLLQQMAFDIVRNDQGKRSRLRDIEEVRDVLKYKKGADVVEGIIFDLSQKSNLYVKADVFDMMVDLRFLRLYVPLGKKRLATLNHSDQGIKQFSDKLRYLEWNGYPFKCLPDHFCAEFLVEIRLPHSNVEYLWHGIQELMNLEAIDLSECKHLTNLPDLSEASKLRSLYLSGCESLCEIQPSIFSKDTLVTLLLDRCTNLQSLVSEKHLKSLQKINVYGCSSLKELLLSSDSIESLDLSNTGVEILQSTISGMSNLLWLNLEGLKLTNLPKELSCLRLLTELRLSNCDIATKSNLEGIFDDMESLKILYLKDCGNLVELPTNISSLSSLYELRLDGSSLETLPSSIKFLSELEILCLDNCRKLHSLPELPLEIKEFRAENCTSLVTVSSLKTFAEKMKGKAKYISFKNDMMMNLNGPSFDRIVEDVILTMQSVAFHNILVRQYSLDAHSYNYNSAVVCLPGSEVPCQFKYRTSDSKITIGFPDIYYSLGFIFWVVISPSNRMKNEDGSGAKIQCKCYREDGNRVGIVNKWYSEPITNLNMDHVFVWYDLYYSHSILGYGKRNVSFEFFLTNDMKEHDGFFNIKECGISPILSTELPRLLNKINLSADMKSDLYNAVKLQSK
ncbi:disease resistance protein RPV1-like [Vicia villosa]|uniref:disease resistance protein RPV1-like n=1 Tax=Vicia villosa TaxID=3911 RepID=UPI00273C40E0|nr:disease resistance protein RPV1-like [Vicia villosa]